MLRRRAAVRPVRSLTERAQTAVANRRVFPYLIGVIAATSLVTGIVVHLIDRKDFPSFGVGVWWAVVTLGTVGYGDVVPHTGWGRVVGSVVIVLGVTFISFLIAIVTSLFVDVDRAGESDELLARHHDIVGLLQGLEGQMTALTARMTALEERIPAPPDAGP
jgi:voltage-gated potassium channel